MAPVRIMFFELAMITNPSPLHSVALTHDPSQKIEMDIVEDEDISLKILSELLE